MNNFIQLSLLQLIFIFLFFFCCQSKARQITKEKALITCSDLACWGSYSGPEFVDGDDVAHQFSNHMSKKVGDYLKEMYHKKSFAKVNFSEIEMSTQGMGSGSVNYFLKIPFELVNDKCVAYTSFDHCGGWNHKPALYQRLNQLKPALLNGDELEISSLKITNEGLQEYWIQWRNKALQDDCEFDSLQHQLAYEALKTRIGKQLNDFSISEKVASKKAYLSNVLIDSIFNYWLGTPWDFNGTSDQPRQGSIACGYFISTTLRDIGFNINRFTIGQKGATDIIKSFCKPDKINRFSTLKQLSFYMNELEENEVLIVGLDFHVGFLYRKNNQNFFVHSNYIENEGVVIELLQESMALNNSASYVVGKIDFVNN